MIAGCESGARYRPVDPTWVREIRDACSAAGVAFFFKQWGGRTPKAGGRELDGRTWDDYPAAVSGDPELGGALPGLLTMYANAKRVRRLGTLIRDSVM